MPADLVAEVLAGDTDGTGVGWFQDIPLDVVPLFRGESSGGGRDGMRAGRHRFGATAIRIAQGSYADSAYPRPLLKPRYS